MQFQPLIQQTIPILDAQSDPKKIVYGQLIPGFQDLASLELAWAPERAKLTNVEHAHWDWRNKFRSLKLGRHHILAIEFNGEIQGAIAVKQQLRQSHRDARLKVLYVDYLEVAPWNLRSYPGGARYFQVGKGLIAATILLSVKNGLAARVGLHSLPQAEVFYRDRCSMTDLGEDSNKDDLRYFEYNEVEALNWLKANDYAA